MLLSIVLATLSWATQSQIECTHLFPGAVADERRGEGIFVSPEGGVQAVDLKSGAKLWASKEADWPLEIVAGALVAARLDRQANRTTIVTLSWEAGKLLTGSESAIPLPPWATPLFTYDDGNQLQLESSAKGGTVTIRWAAKGISAGGRQLNPLLNKQLQAHGRVQYDASKGSLEPLPSDQEGDLVLFPSYSPVGAGTDGQTALWPPAQVGGLTIYIAETKVSKVQLNPIYQAEARALTPSGTVLWKLNLGSRHPARLRA